MLVFHVKDMTCGRCAATITRALQAADPQAQVQIEVAQGLVRITPGQASPAALQTAIAQAGYTAELAPAQRAGQPAAGRPGCGCASRAGAGAIDMHQARAISPRACCA